MQRDADLLATFQSNQCQNASRKLHAGSPLCFRRMGGWRHASYYDVTDRREGGDYERTRPDSRKARLINHLRAQDICLASHAGNHICSLPMLHSLLSYLAEAIHMSDLTFLSAISMAEQIRQKKLSPVELVEAHLAKITRLNPQLNAFVQIDSDAALRQARVAEHSVTQTQTLGPLHGVPLSIKRSIDVGGGFRCEAGTRLRAGCVPSPDAPLVARLRKAGAIILGVTNTPELLMAWETDNLLYGRTNNPWDLSRTPGGSSGGEAAAIASGCSAGGVGSDGGGSIRVPAHFSGICGLKPTPGRIPATGHFPQSVGPFALLGVVGPMARTVADLKLLFEVMQGPDDGDPSTAPLPVRWPGPNAVKQLRIASF